MLGAIMSGDEADVEKYDETRSVPRIRDFGNERGEPSKSPERKREKKSKKHSKRKHKERRGSQTEAADNKDGEKHVQVQQQAAQPSVNFAETVQEAESGAPGPKRPFNLRQISLRPALPQSVLNSVFFAPPPDPATAPGPRAPIPRVPRVSHNRLRRTTSLPDRLNQTYRADPVSRQIAGQGILVSGPELDSHTQVDEVKEAEMSRTAAVALLLISTGLVALCAEFLVDAIPELNSSGVSQAFISLIILPIVGNAAEHVTAVTVAAKNKMDLAIGVAVGSSIQIGELSLVWVCHKAPLANFRPSYLRHASRRSARLDDGQGDDSLL
jgi:Ca2+:H+ antiporter